MIVCDCIFSMDHVLTPFDGQISPTEIRGALGSINQLFICIGILVALVAGLPLSGNPLWYYVVSPVHLTTVFFVWGND